MIWDRTDNINGVAPYFALLQLDLKSRTINLIGNGWTKSVQHYVDDGKGAPAIAPQGGAMLAPQPGQPGFAGPGFIPGQGFPALPPGFQPGGMPPGGFVPPPRVRIRIADPDVQVLPAPALPEKIKR
jgi:hypothetical protein